VLYEGNRPEGVDLRPRTPLGFEFFPRIATRGTRLAMGGDLQWIYGPFSVSADYIRNVEEQASSTLDAVIQGWDFDITYLITGEDKIRAMESGIEIAARIENLRVDAGSLVNVIGFSDEFGNPVSMKKNQVTTMTLGINYYLNYNVKFQLNYQNDWFGNELFTPTSRDGNSLQAANTSRGKLLARVQLYF